MNNKLKMLIEKIIEIMNAEGIGCLSIRRQGRYNNETNQYEDTDEYKVSIDLDKQIRK